MIDEKDIQILSQVNWAELKDKTIFLSGATGFIGKNILYVLDWANKEYELGIVVYCLVRNKAKLDAFAKEHNIECARFVGGDLVSIDFRANIRADYVINSACPSDTTLSNYKELLEINYSGIKNLILNFPESKILHISSGRAGANSGYGKAKQVGEWVIETHKNHIIARVFGVVGPFIDINSGLFITNLLRAKRDGKPIKANENAFRSYIYSIELAAHLLELMIDKRGIFEVGNPLADSLDKLCKTIGVECESFSGEYDDCSPRKPFKDTNYRNQEAIEKTLKILCGE